MGVAEHIFDVTIHGKAVTWHLYDVGGARGQRHSWIPYFDDANAIIFVAPVSAFDQVSYRCYSSRYFPWIKFCRFHHEDNPFSDAFVFYSISKKIREQTGLMTLCNYSLKYAQIVC